MTVRETRYVERRHVGQVIPARIKPVMRHLDVELTERCNNNCIHCCINRPAGDKQAQRNELPTAAIEEVLFQAARLGTRTVRLTGGEPLLRPDFAEIYLFARRLGMRVLLFTNARLITRELAELFVRVPPGDPIDITVYGMRRESYEAVARARDSFAEFQRGIDLLRECKVPFTIKGVFLPETREEVAELDAWGATLPELTRRPLITIFYDLRNRRDSPARDRVIAGLRPEPRLAVDIMSRDRQVYIKDLREFAARFVDPPGDRLFTCGAGQNLSLDAYGVLQPCLLLRHPDVVYDIKRGSLESALADFYPMVRAARASNCEYLERCARCFIRWLCEQCPGRAWIEHGTLDTPVEHLCQIAHEQARDLGLLQGTEKGWQVKGAEERLAHFIKVGPSNYQEVLST